MGSSRAWMRLRLVVALLLGFIVSVSPLAATVPATAAPAAKNSPEAASSPKSAPKASTSSRVRRAAPNDPPGPPFDCTEPTWFLSQGNPTTRMWSGSFRDDGSAVIAPLSTNTYPQYNGIGFDPADDYIYGMLLPTGVPQVPGGSSSDLLQIDRTGSVTNLGPVVGLPAGNRNIGAFDDAGNYWVTGGTTTSPARTLYEISIASQEVIRSETLTGDPFVASDFTYADGFMWGLEGSTLYRIDLADGAVTAFPNAVTVDPAIYGAAWTFGNGNLGFSNNNSGRIFQIHVNNPTSATPTFSLVGAPYRGPASGNNDGTSCVPKPVDLGIVKSGPRYVAERGTVRWSLTVTNHGPGNSGGYAVTDTVPAGVTNVRQVVAPGNTSACDTTVNPVRCSLGALADGDSFTITLEGTVTAPAPDCVTNTATVTGMEADNDPSNDSSDWSTCVLAVQLQKSANQDGFNAPGTSITYTYIISNPNNVDLTLTSLNDDPLGPINCAESVIPARSSITCTKDHSTSQPEVDAGGISNVATVTAQGPDNVVVTDQASDNVPAAQNPGIQLVKSSDSPPFSGPDAVITFHYTVTNTGNVTLDPVTVTDGLAGLSAIGDCTVSGNLVANGGVALAPNQSMTCSATYVTQQSDVDAGGVTNSGTAIGQPPSGSAVQSTDNATVKATQSPDISVTKSGTPPSYAVGGTQITYEYVVTNTGNVTLDPVTVTDSNLGPITCPEDSLAPNASMTCEASYSITPADIDRGQVDNTATAVGKPPSGRPVQNSADETVLLERKPAISVVKSANVNEFSATGTTITYSFLVVNNGNVTLSAIGLVDNRFGSVSCPEDSLPAGDDMDCTAVQHATTQTDLDRGGIRDTATVTGTAPSGDTVTGQSSVRVPAVQSPAIRVVKTASPSRFGVAGATIRYRYRVTNTGNVTLDPVRVSDDRPGLSVSCPGRVLAPGASMTCTASYTTTQADLDRGSVVNTATATGRPPRGARVTADSGLIVRARQRPALTVTKTARPARFGRPGVRIGYSYVVTNSGNVTLAPVSLSDDRVGFVCSATSLAPGASITCTASYVTTQADLDRGAVKNIATATGTGPQGQPARGEDSATVNARQRPAIRLIKSATFRRFDAAGTRITYIYLIVNTGNVTLNQISLRDSRLGDITCPSGDLAPGQPRVCTAMYTTTQGNVDAGGIRNTGTVTGVTPGGSSVSDTSSLRIPATRNPAISVDKSASVPSFAAAGTPITYRFVVANTGNVTLSQVSLVDSRLGAVSCPQSSLAPTDTMTCTADYTTTPADVDAGQITNTATVTGRPPSGAPVTDTSRVMVPAQQRPAIGILKLARPRTFAVPGVTITYRYLVTNSGNVTLNPVTVTDNRLGTVSCPQTSLAVGTRMTCTATHTTSQADVDAGGITNTGTATGRPPGGANVSDTSSYTVWARQHPGIHVEKTAEPSSFSAAGTTISYRYRVTNTGNETLSPVGVSDPLPGLSRVDCPSNSLAPGASMTCTATRRAGQADLDAGSVVNLATAGGNTAQGATVSDQSTATVTGAQRAGIRIVKSATPARFDAPGTVIRYRFRVTNTGNVTLDPVTVADNRLGAIGCPGTTPASSRSARHGLVLAPGASVTCTASYKTSDGDLDHGSIANVATATGTPPSGRPVTDRSRLRVQAVQRPALFILKFADSTGFDAPGVRISYRYLVINTGNVTLDRVAVTDSKPGMSAVSCPDTSLPAGQTMTCTAHYTTRQADLDHGRIDNTGTAHGTAPNGTKVTARHSRRVPALQSPVIRIVKTASRSSFHTAGVKIHYRYRVTNEGNLTLHRIRVSDILPGLSAISCPHTTLAPGASMTCTAHYTTTAADVRRHRVDNTGQATSTAANGVTVSARQPLTIAATERPTPPPPPPTSPPPTSPPPTSPPPTSPPPTSPPASPPGLGPTGMPAWTAWLAALGFIAIIGGVVAVAAARRDH